MQLNISQITFLLKHEISLFIFTYKIHKILQEVDVKIKIFLFSQKIFNTFLHSTYVQSHSINIDDLGNLNF